MDILVLLVVKIDETKTLTLELQNWLENSKKKMKITPDK